jgi:glucosylceramidase
LTTSFLNQDGKVAVVMNESDVEVKYNLCIGTKATEVVILPRNPNISLLTSFFTYSFF